MQPAIPCAPGNFKCPHCETTICFNGKELLKRHFRNNSSCEKCIKNINIFDLIVNYLNNNRNKIVESITPFPPFLKRLVRATRILAFQTIEVDLSKHIPGHVKVYSLNLTNSDFHLLPVYPIIIHGNCLPEAPTLKFRLYGSVESNSFDATKTLESFGKAYAEFDMLITYIDPDKLTLVDEYFYYAANAFNYNNWKDVVINLSIVAEISVSKACRIQWEKLYSIEQVEILEKIEYSQKLKLVLKTKNKITLDEEIQKLLRMLLEHRNKLMHTGLFKENTQPPSQYEIAQMVTAVLFLTEYCSLLVCN